MKFVILFLTWLGLICGIITYEIYFGIYEAVKHIDNFILIGMGILYGLIGITIYSMINEAFNIFKRH
jgi:hypothetical protein